MKIDGIKFEAARVKSGLTMVDLVRTSRLTYNRIWQVCTDKESHVNDLSAEAMAKAMGVKVEELQ